MNQILLSFLIILLGCTNTGNQSKLTSKDVLGKSIQLSDSYIKLCYGIETEVDTSNLMEKAMYLLNKSDYRGCINVMKCIKGGIDTIYWHSGFYALIIPDSNINSYKVAKVGYNAPINYLSFRYNNFISDIDNNEEGILFQNSVDANATNELFKLQAIEWGTLYDTLRTPDSIGAIEVIKYSNELKRKYPESKRLAYLIANSYLTIGNETAALTIYDQLLSKNYYALPILRKIVTYFGKANRNSEQEKYVAIFKEKFPDECLFLNSDFAAQINTINKMCKKCLKNGTQRDSINANIYLAKYSLQNKLYNQVDSITNIYFNKSGKRDSYDRLKLYEDEVYPDIKMRSLFLRGNYAQIIKYYSSPNIGEKRKSEFRNKMKVYYNDYISKDTTSFQSFFSKSFQQFQNKEYKNKESQISNSEEFDQRSELKRHDSITEITDSIFQILYQRNCDDLKQFYALYKFQSTDTVENLYSCISQFFKISSDSAYKRFTINLDKIYKLNQNLNLFVIEDNSVQNFLGVGGLILAQISSNNDLICISICDNYQIKSSTYIEIYKEVRDKVYATQLNYKSKVGLFLPVLAHSVIKAK